MADVIQTALFGLVGGCVLAIGAVGFALIRQIEGFLNLAHGQYLALGAMLGFVFTADIGLPVVVSGVAVALIIGAVSVGAARIIIEPVKDQGALVLLFSSVGVAFVIYAFIIAVFGPEVHTYPVGFGQRVEIGAVSLTLLELIIIGLAAVIAAALHVFLTKTRLGTAIRATASSADLARVRGLPVVRVSVTVWFVAGALAGIGGMLYGILGGVTGESGWAVLALILAATVVGGLGRIYGVMAAAVVLGILMDLSTLVLPTAYRPAVAFALLILVLLVRPEGLFSIRRRREEIA